MASSSSSSSLPRTWKYNVFTSFHGPDVRKTFLSHLRTLFKRNGITMFDDTEIERSDIIAPALKLAIRESRISIVVLSKKYASSSWCLDELLEILKCKEDAGQIVMTVFYGVDPSHVRKQSEDFGDTFNKTCIHKTEDKRRKWREALTYVGNIAGEDFKNWDNEADMIEKIANDVSDKLNVTPSRDFEGMVGFEAHLGKMESLLDLDNYRVKIVGISGPAGIGKSTIARALQSRLSNRFSLSFFLDNLRESNLVEYGSKLRLQTQLLSTILNQDGIRVAHLGVLKQRLHDKKVLIILDDVDSLDTLEVLANINWFGPGSRVIVTTENNEILQQYGINDTYHVGFPSDSEALMIFSQSAFQQTYPPYGFMILADEVARICGKLPLGLQVLGSSLRGKSHSDWIVELPRLKKSLDRRIESVLKLGYENLDERDQSLFLFIAVFFNYKHVDYVTSMLAKNNLDVKLGLKNLTNRCFIRYEDSRVVMHHLLQVMARQVISKQESWKRQILVDTQQICYVLENANGNGSIEGIFFDVAEINELKIGPRAFEKLYNLFFLEVYDQWYRRKRQIHISEEMEFLPPLRLLRWDAYPRKSLPLRFCPENLIELDMRHSKLEKLWEAPQPLANLKKMNLRGSFHLKELPDLSNATNLEILNLSSCRALVELPSSFSNLHKLVELELRFCQSLEVIPSLINLVSLERIYMGGCSRLRNFPNIGITNHRLIYIDVIGSANLKTFSIDHPTSVQHLNLNGSGIARITDCIKDLHNLEVLYLSRCKRLVSLPELPSLLIYLFADNCESLESVSFPLNTSRAVLDFSNSFKLNREARRTIIQGSFVSGFAVLPGREVPADFNHRARGNFLTIPHSAFNKFKVCLVISPDVAADQDNDSDDYEFNDSKALSGCINIDSPIQKIYHNSRLESEHLLIFQHRLSLDGAPIQEPSEVSRQIVLQFNSCGFAIVECGIQILPDESESDHFDTHEAFDEEETSNEEEASEKEDYEFELAQAPDKEDDEKVYKSESGEDKDEGDYESVSRKRTRETMSDKSDEASDEEDYESERTMITNVRWGIKRRRC